MQKNRNLGLIFIQLKTMKHMYGSNEVLRKKLLEKVEHKLVVTKNLMYVLF